MSTKYFHYRRRKLLYEDPHCHWCGKELYYYKTKGGKLPDDFATIDHLESKLLGERKDVQKKKKTLVLACPACNNKRSKDELEKYKDIQSIKSGRLKTNNMSKKTKKIIAIHNPPIEWLSHRMRCTKKRCQECLPPAKNKLTNNK